MSLRTKRHLLCSYLLMGLSVVASEAIAVATDPSLGNEVLKQRKIMFTLKKNQLLDLT